MVPPDRDQKKVDAFTKKNYSVAAMLARIYTYLSYMSAYVLSMSTRISDLCQDQASSSSSLSKILPLANEVSLVSKQHICTLHHAVSYTSPALANGIAQRVMHGWRLHPYSLISSLKWRIFPSMELDFSTPLWTRLRCR